MNDVAVSFPAAERAAQSALGTLLSRASVSPVQLREPAPEGRELDSILAAGLRAPDHGRLRPWHFLLIRGSARDALGAIFARSLEARDPAASAGLLERMRLGPLRAPLVIALVAKLRPDHAVPEVEQLLSAGAAAMNLLNAAHALGYGGMWLTGKSCYDPMVHRALGVRDPDRLIGFLHVGTPREPVRPAERADSSAHVSEWTGSQ